MKKKLSNKYLGGDMDLVEGLCVRRTVHQVIPSYQKLREVPVLFYQIKITIMEYVEDEFTDALIDAICGEDKSSPSI